jgi:hypothetical protein
MGARGREAVVFLDQLREGFPLDRVDGLSAVWRATYPEVKIDVVGDVAESGELEVTLEVSLVGDGSDRVGFGMSRVVVAPDPAMRRRHLGELRALIGRVNTLAGVVQSSLKHAITTCAAGTGSANDCLGPSWVGLHLEACLLSGQARSLSWVMEVERRVERLAAGLSAEHRLHLSREVWTKGARLLAEGRGLESGRQDLDGWPKEVTREDPGTDIHRVFLRDALRGLNVVRAHERPWPREAIALVDHPETQCSVALLIEAEHVHVTFAAMLKQGWIGRDLEPVFGYTETLLLSELDDPTRSDLLARRLRDRISAFASRKAIVRSTERESAGETVLFPRHQLDGALAYWHVLAATLDGRAATPRWLENTATKFADRAALRAGEDDSVQARLARADAREAVFTAGIIAMAAQNGITPTNRPHAFAHR